MVVEHFLNIGQKVLEDKEYIFNANTQHSKMFRNDL